MYMLLLCVTGPQYGGTWPPEGLSTSHLSSTKLCKVSKQPPTLGLCCMAEGDVYSTIARKAWPLANTCTFIRQYVSFELAPMLFAVGLTAPLRNIFRFNHLCSTAHLMKQTHLRPSVHSLTHLHVCVRLPTLSGISVHSLRHTLSPSRLALMSLCPLVETNLCYPLHSHFRPSVHLLKHTYVSLCPLTLASLSTR